MKILQFNHCTIKSFQFGPKYHSHRTNVYFNLSLCLVINTNSLSYFGQFALLVLELFEILIWSFHHIFTSKIIFINFYI